MDLSYSEYDLVVGPLKHRNGLLVSIKWENFLTDWVTISLTDAWQWSVLLIARDKSYRVYMRCGGSTLNILLAHVNANAKLFIWNPSSNLCPGLCSFSFHLVAKQRKRFVVQQRLTSSVCLVTWPVDTRHTQAVPWTVGLRIWALSNCKFAINVANFATNCLMSNN
jgi:hypothetical protein